LLIREARKQRGEQVTWANEIERDLENRANFDPALTVNKVVRPKKKPTSRRVSKKTIPRNPRKDGR
jgi:hypothetical protein